MIEERPFLWHYDTLDEYTSYLPIYSSFLKNGVAKMSFDECINYIDMYFAWEESTLKKYALCINSYRKNLKEFYIKNKIKNTDLEQFIANAYPFEYIFKYA